jgi:hypothetical protein
MKTAVKDEYTVRLRQPHPHQEPFLDSTAKRKIIRAGRRGGKTVGVSILAVKALLARRRVLYAAPTMEQIDRFWKEAKRALHELIEADIYYKNETLHIIERPDTDERIRAKTAWNADTLRGDYADLLILDEWQLMSEDTWSEVGAPMLLDNNGDAVFVYTPPSLHSRSVTKARDPRHAAKMFAKAEQEVETAAKEGRISRWATFHFSSHDNPHLSREALEEITIDMSSLSFQQEILAQDIDEVPGALWTRELVFNTRVLQHPPLARVVVGVDPPGGATECGIVAVGKGTDGQLYILSDRSLKASPDTWAGVAIDAYNAHSADRIVGEANYGGDMVENTIAQAAASRKLTVAYKNVHASRGKAVRAEPIVAIYEQGRAHHVGEFPHLEEEMCTWIPGESRYSPNRVDALVWAMTELTATEQQERIVTFDAMQLVDMDL